MTWLQIVNDLADIYRVNRTDHWLGERNVRGGHWASTTLLRVAVHNGLVRFKKNVGYITYHLPDIYVDRTDQWVGVWDGPKGSLGGDNFVRVEEFAMAYH